MKTTRYYREPATAVYTLSSLQRRKAICHGRKTPQPVTVYSSRFSPLAVGRRKPAQSPDLLSRRNRCPYFLFFSFFFFLSHPSLSSSSLFPLLFTFTSLADAGFTVTLSLPLARAAPVTTLPAIDTQSRLKFGGDLPPKKTSHPLTCVYPFSVGPRRKNGS